MSLEGRGHGSVKMRRFLRCLAISVRLSFVACFATQVCRPPQDKGPLPATGEARSSVSGPCIFPELPVDSCYPSFSFLLDSENALRLAFTQRLRFWSNPKSKTARGAQ